MKTKFLKFLLGWVMIISAAYAGDRSEPLIIDHLCTDLSQIPDRWIDSVQVNFRMYYVHTSHGEQLTIGMQRIENSDQKYDVAIGNLMLPNESQAFCIFDNAEGDPTDYWYSNEYENGMDKTRQILSTHPTIKISMFMWCVDLYYEGEAYVQAYLDSLAKLEREFPAVTFIYATCHAQYDWSPQYNLDGYNRYLRNEQIRSYCKQNNKILYDFENLDSWWFNPSTQQWEQNTAVVQGHVIPMQHSHYEGDQAGHTTYESCEQKGKAVWWMLAKMAGWEDVVPVELVSFEAYARGKFVQLSWQTASESNNFGFEIERSSNKKYFQKIGFMKGKGTINVPQKYQFNDQTVEPGNYYYYRLKQINLDGAFEYSDVIELSLELPQKYNLQQNYPNPFNPETMIGYELAQDNFITITVFDIRGNTVKTLVKSGQIAGHHELKWSGTDDNGQRLASGIYFLQMNVKDSFYDTKKMIMMQ